MNPQLRKAQKQDCPRLLELIHELAIYEKAPQEVTVSLTEFEDAGFGPNPVWDAYVVEIEGNIEGMALYYIRYSTWKGRRIYLEDIIVTDKHRGKGLGTLLFEHVLQVSKDKKYSGLVWQVLDWNEPAINFYNKYKAEYDKGWLNGSITNN
jgi:GNAT superfamily N-acetyltransferase